MKLRTLIKPAPLFIAAAAAALVGAHSGTAEAKEIVHGADCTFDPSPNFFDYLIGPEGMTNKAPSARRLFCPVPSTIRESLNGSVLVDGLDGSFENSPNGRVRAQVCVRAWFDDALVDCSVQTELTGNTFTGLLSAPPGNPALDADDMAKLRDPSKLDWYAMLVVSLPGCGTNITTCSRMYGYSAF